MSKEPINFTISGNGIKSLSTKLNRNRKGLDTLVLEKYAQEALQALRIATPVDTGKTASSWYYEIVRYRNNVELIFKNWNMQDGVNIAILLQYGHGTRNGGYVRGIDYINPAIQPIVKRIADEAQRELNK